MQKVESQSPVGLSQPKAADEIPAALTWGLIWRAPLDHLANKFFTRFWIRLLLGVFRSRVLEVKGLQHIQEACDPFILAPNHSQRLEALLLPSLLALNRRGKMVHFLTDWLVLLYPLIGRIVLLNEPIIVTRKNAKFKWMNLVRKRYENPLSAFDQARRFLAQKRPIGLYPEGTMNRDRSRLLRGQSGVAQLSLACRVPVVPVGIRFPQGRPGSRVGDLEPMVIEFGQPLFPPEVRGGGEPEVHEIRDWHGQIMQAISSLSGKQWTPDNQRTRYVA
ncbi:MAG: 1-acyl-sn-glycerol-3-phosphate acyltransferase [Verrucomicrobiales bacterium]|nr:1-acyl-sn-glycerol-3-phosphate acyltransferase [Verrucomicrobiales bacterium]